MFRFRNTLLGLSLHMCTKLMLLLINYTEGLTLIICCFGDSGSLQILTEMKWEMGTFSRPSVMVSKSMFSTPE